MWTKALPFSCHSAGLFASHLIHLPYLGQELVERGVEEANCHYTTRHGLEQRCDKAKTQTHRPDMYIHHFVVRLDEKRLSLFRVEATPRENALPSMSFCWNT
jgi:hypothetical protein